MPKFEVRQSTDAFDVETLHGKFDEPRIEFDRPPTFEFTTPLRSGIERTTLGIGKEVQIRRIGEMRFPGVIDTPEDRQGSGASLLTLRGMHKGYKQIQRAKCDNYDFDADDLAITTRDAITINPWKYTIFRKGSGTIDAYGDTLAIDGVRPDEIARCLIGTRFIHQHEFVDNSFLLTDAIYSATGRIQTYIDGPAGDDLPALQRVRVGPNFRPGGAVESVPLESGDPNIDAMGTISAVDVLLVGELGNSDHPTIRVCRNARDVRSYTSVTLTPTANYLSSGKYAWAGSLTFADAPANLNSLGYELTIPGAGGIGNYHAGAFSEAGNLWFAESIDTGVNWNYIPIVTGGINWEWNWTMTHPPGSFAVQAARFKALSSTDYVVVYLEEHEVGTGSTTRMDLKLARSTDSGATWVTSLIESGAKFYGATGQFDFETFGTTNLYVVYDFNPSGGGRVAKLRFAKSTNSGTNWTISDIVATAMSGFSPAIRAIDANNIIVVSYGIGGTPDIIRAYKSADAGATWPTTGTVSTDYPMGAGGPGGLAVLDATTYLYVYGSQTSDAVTKHLKVAKTTDSGATWSSTTIATRTSGYYSSALATAITSTNVIFVANVMAGSVAGAGAKFFNTTNGGTSYSGLTAITTDGESIADRVRSLVAMSATTYLYYIGALSEWKSTNSGAAWTRRAIKSSAGYVDNAPRNELEGTFIEVVVTPETQSTATTKINYIKLTATTASDVSLTEGTISTYAPPDLVGIDANAKKWIEEDFSNIENRMLAMERLRKRTRSSTSANSSPHWDAWIDANLAFHFKERRGAAIARTYSFEAQNLAVLEHESFGGEIAYQTIAYGAGSGEAQSRIVSKAAFSAGGLYDSDRDPTIGGTPLYGKAARIMDFQDSNETSAVSLLSKAWASHKKNRVPVENYKIKIIPETPRYFDVGDSIILDNLKSQASNAVLRCVGLSRGWSGSDSEQLEVDLGEKRDDFEGAIAAQASATQVIATHTQTRPINHSTSGDSIYFDATNYGVGSFHIEDGRKLRRCQVRITTLPWQTIGKPTTTTAPAPMVNQAKQSWAIGTNLNTATTPHLTTLAVLEPKAGVYSGLAIEINLVNQTGSSQNYFWELQCIRGALITSLESGTVVVPDSQSHVIVRTANASSSANPMVGDSVRLRIFSGTLGTSASRTAQGSVALAITSLTSGTVPPLTGMWQFDGDGGNGQGNPVYCQGVRIAVDPTLSAAGLPTNFGGECHPTRMGISTASQTFTWDVTGWLKVDAAGVIRSGGHHLFLKSASGANNGGGLARASVSILLEVED